LDDTTTPGLQPIRYIRIIASLLETPHRKMESVRRIREKSPR
jgi:hypothetical protein